MRFLITGGAPFIGWQFADDLLARGHRVHGRDPLGGVDGQMRTQIPSSSEGAAAAN